MPFSRPVIFYFSNARIKGGCTILCNWKITSSPQSDKNPKFPSVARKKAVLVLAAFVGNTVYVQQV